jgi:N-acetylmuramoyl-L-alanine amidase CwlA
MITAPLTNRAYGYPTRGAARRRKPTVLAVLHQTANAKAGPMDERDYANRAGSMGPSATAYVGKDGTVVRAVDPVKYAAWSQGDVAHPDALAQAHIVAGVNFNEVVLESIEVCGSGTQPFSAAQFEAVAQILAAAHRATGLPVDRAHVLAHADVNSVSRASDPWPASTREAYMRRVIDRANAILRPPITTVTIKAGDTLSGVAAAHGLTLAALLAFPENSRYRAEPALIHPGDLVRVK